MDKLISIIVPVYKVEKYLEKCIDSIINQTYKNIEIILVDDGSPDNCGKICDEYSKKDERIKVIHKENGGLSAARNDGFNISKGEYITFVDSDDYISHSFCEKMLSAIIDNDAEIAISDVNKFVETEGVKEEAIIPELKVYGPEETIYNLINVAGQYDSAWGKLYARSIIEGIEFPVGRIYEDSATVFKYFYKAKRIAVSNERLYYYLIMRKDSIIGSNYNEKKQNDNYFAIEERNGYLLKVLPQMKDVINSGYIRNALTLIERTYLSENIELINSEVIKNVENKVINLLQDIDKNIMHQLLSNYKLMSLYLFLENREIYQKTIKELVAAKK